MTTFTVKRNAAGCPCYPFWTIMNCNQPHIFLNKEYVTSLPRVKPFIRQVNAVYLLGGRHKDRNHWYKGVRADGSLDTDFSGMIAQLQGMLACGMTPWPVLDNVPHAMSDPPQENAFGNTAPPADESVWEKYVEAALQAMVDAFGKATVETWWFRVGTEPDYIPGHWAGTREQFLEHYERTVAAFERVIPGAKIGPGNVLNPAGGEYGTETFHQWGPDFFDHCAATGTRMDWFSFSWYGHVGVSNDYFDQAVAMIRERAARFPQFKELPLIVGEFAVLHDESNCRIFDGDASEWGASFYASIARRVYQYRIAQVYEWAQTSLDVWQPRTHVIHMLQGMCDGELLAVELRDKSDLDAGIVACRKDGAIHLLLYNHHAHREPKVPETFDITVEDGGILSGSLWDVSETTIDHEHGVWVHEYDRDCRAAGVQPLPSSARFEGQPFKRYGEPGVTVFLAHREKYRRLGAPLVCQDRAPVASEEGRLRISFAMPGHSVRLVTLTPGVTPLPAQRR